MKKIWLIFAAAALLAALAPLAMAQGYAYGDSADEVAMIQEALEELDLYYADITGHYGRKTERAVTLFQRKYRLPQTGVADEITIAKLKLVTGVSVPEKKSDDTILRLNTRNDAVKKLQEDLTVLGFYTGEVTGKYGNKTKEAVRRFQRANGLSSDGVAGPKTLAEVAHELGKEIGDAGEEEKDDSAKTESAAAAAPDADAALTKPADDAVYVSLRDVTLLNTERVLRRRSSSGYVTRLQNALNVLGYFPAEPTGYFGSETEKAVKAYQTAKGLSVDGVAGRATLTAINKDIEAKRAGTLD